MAHSCGGATEDITVALGGSTEVSQSLTASVNIGLDLDVLNIGGGIESSSSNTTTESKTITYSIPPGKQAVYVAGVAYTSQTGNVQVNYGDRQFGHYIVRAFGFLSGAACWALTRGRTCIAVVHGREHHPTHAQTQ